MEITIVNKVQYICKKVFLHLPSSLYRLKLPTIELDSMETSRLSIATNQIKHADFLQEFSILRQNYPLMTNEELNDLVMFLESAFKDVYSLEGDESALLEIILINSIMMFVSEKFDEVYKNMETAREILFNLSKCPLEILSFMQMFAGLLWEKDNIIESEKEYLMSMIHYFVVMSDPRGRGAYSSNYLLGLSWKASMVAHYFKKQIDSELWEEILDATLYNLNHAKMYERDIHSNLQDKNSAPSKKWTKMFGLAPTKNKFSKPIKTSPYKPTERDSNTKINIDDIDVDLLSQFNSETGDPFDDLKYILTENRFLFYHWNTYKGQVEDIEDYMTHGAGNPLDFFIFLLRWNPCMFLGGIKFTSTQIKEFTFSDGVNNILSFKSTSSIASGLHNFSSSMSNSSIASNVSGISGREPAAKKQRSLHHGAYQHILNKDHFALSRSEGNGVVYVWGTDTQGQLGWANVANMKLDEMDNEFKRNYPRILIGLKDLIIKEIWCGNEHSLAVTLKGEVYAWGNNRSKQLGIGYNTPDFVNQPTRVFNVGSVKSISWGYEHSVALTEAGELYSWGHGEGGLLGHGELDNQAVPKMIVEFKKK